MPRTGFQPPGRGPLPGHGLFATGLHERQPVCMQMCTQLNLCKLNSVRMGTGLPLMQVERVCVCASRPFTRPGPHLPLRAGPPGCKSWGLLA